MSRCRFSTILSIGFVSLLLFSCRTTQVVQSHRIETANTNDQIKLKSFLVSSTLAQSKLGYPNTAFRKINRFSPAMYEGQIIAANGYDGLVSYNKSTMAVNWRFYINQGVESAGLVAGGQLFIGGLDGFFYSIDLDTGKLTWKFDTKSEIVAEPILNKGAIYFLNGANALFSLDAGTGKQLWVYNRQETSTKMTVRGGSRPVIEGDMIYVGFSDGSLAALNSLTGTPQWEVLLNKNNRFKDIDSSPVIDGDRIYMNSYDDKLYCLSKSNGSILWKSESGGASAPLISGDFIVYSTSKNQILSVSKNDGKAVWSYNHILGVATEPILHKGMIIVGESQGDILIFDLLTGAIKAKFEPGRGVMSKPSIVENNQILFMSNEGNLYGLRIQKKRKSEIPYLIQ
jgi:outer membrane protein assembly factor BamB